MIVVGKRALECFTSLSDHSIRCILFFFGSFSYIETKTVYHRLSSIAISKLI